jgi:hypothetical protein
VQVIEGCGLAEAALTSDSRVEGGMILGWLSGSSDIGLNVWSWDGGKKIDDTDGRRWCLL